MLHLYLVRRNDDCTNYDEAAGFLVCAYGPADARVVLAQANQHGDEGPDVWQSTHDREGSTVKHVGRAARGMKRGILLVDFKGA